MKFRPEETELFDLDGRTDKQKTMTKIIGAFQRRTLKVMFKSRIEKVSTVF
jgi:hypothetical protein